MLDLNLMIVRIFGLEFGREPVTWVLSVIRFGAVASNEESVWARIAPNSKKTLDSSIYMNEPAAHEMRKHDIFGQVERTCCCIHQR